MNIEEKKQQRAMLLHFAGPAVDEIFVTLPDTDEAKDYDKAVEALNAYLIPQINTAYEEYNIRQAKQRDNETLDAYHTRLRQLSQNCSFADVDKEIKNQIIIGCSSQKLRRRALRDNHTLKELLDAGRAEETSQATITPTRENSKINVRVQAAPAIKNTIQRILAHLKPAVTVVAYILILKSAQQKAKNVIHAKILVIFQKFAEQAKNPISNSQRDTEFAMS